MTFSFRASFAARLVRVVGTMIRVGPWYDCVSCASAGKGSPRILASSSPGFLSKPGKLCWFQLATVPSSPVVETVASRCSKTTPTSPTSFTRTGRASWRAIAVCAAASFCCFTFSITRLYSPQAQFTSPTVRR